MKCQKRYLRTRDQFPAKELIWAHARPERVDNSQVGRRIEAPDILSLLAAPNQLDLFAQCVPPLSIVGACWFVSGRKYVSWRK